MSNPKLDNIQSAEEKRILLARLLEKKAQASKLAYPLSYNQQGMWFLYKFHPYSPAYNVAFTVRIRSAVDRPSLRRALQKLVDRHPALRTIITEQQGELVQQIYGYREVHFEEIDASNLNEEQLYEQVVTTYQQPFDLENGPLFRAHLFARSTTDHVLLLAAHHIIMDGWSVWVLLDELRHFYTAEKAGRNVSLPSLKRQYADYVQWQHDLVAGPEGERLWNYWQQQLDGELPVLNLPTDHPRPASQTYNGASHLFELDAQLIQRIKILGQAEMATLYTMLLTAFQVLLYRYSHQGDILIGSPVTDRTQAEFTGVIGDFVNMVVLRANLSGNPSFRMLLHQSRHSVLDMFDHQGCPFSLLVERLGLQRDLSRSPIFQVAFDLQRLQQAGELAQLLMPDVKETSINFGDLKLEPYQIPQQEGQFDVTLQLLETNGSLVGVFKYNTDLFKASTIAQMARNYQTLLQAIIANPDCPIAELPVLSQPERQQLLVDWNQTQAPYPHSLSLAQLFEAQVEQTPEAVAVVFEGHTLTYRQLNQQANQLAYHLQTLGVGPDVLVGIYLERSLEMVVALLAVLKAGGAYVPLDPIFPPDRLAFMLADSQARVLLTQKRLLADAPQHQAQVVCIDTDWPIIARHSQHNLNLVLSPSLLAYVIYTSGSTGKPKGVQIERRALLNFLTSMQREPGLSTQDVLLAVTTLSFDIAGLELFLPLLVGARLVVVSSAVAADGSQLLQHITSSGATVMQATPATWRLLIAAGWSKDQPLKVICGGEAMPRELADQLLQRSDCVWNIYGPTETTVWSTLHRVTPGTGPVSIGRPIANTQVYILDAQLQPVPIGVTGEFYIGGDGLARGYLNRPDLTAEKFIPDPFSPEPGRRLYRTGDLARYWPDGTIDFLGRIDHQVKVRGFRIELGEIETALEQHPAIRQTVVLVREDTPGDKRLVAYMITDTTPPSASDLRSSLKDKLPDYMIPSLFVFLDSYPLTPNGKVDRRALPAPGGLRPDLEATYIAPQTDTERQIASVWQEVLHLEKVGINDNFFELGGHSLLVIQIHNKLHQVFDKELSVIDMFRYPTIASLADFLSHESAESLQKVEQRIQRQKQARQARRKVR